MSLTYTITVRALGRSRYEVYHGSMYLCTSHEPLCEASRVLLSIGYAQSRDIIEMFHEGSPTCSLRSQIGKAAKTTVEETAHGPAFRRYVSKPVKTPVHASNEAPRYTPSFA